MIGKNTRILVVDEVTQHINLEKKLIELQAISGMTVDEIIKKFKAGYTLKEPDYALKLSEVLNYVSYLWVTEKTLVPGFAGCFTNFKNTVPEKQEIEELVEYLKKDLKAKTIILLGYFPVYTKEEVT